MENSLLLSRIILGMFTDPLPSNGRRVAARVCSRGNVFTESICHSTLVMYWTQLFTDYSSLLPVHCCYYSCPAEHFLKPFCTNPTEGTVFCCQESVFTGPLPSNGCPIIACACVPGMFTNPLASSGYTRHNVMLKFIVLVLLNQAQVVSYTALNMCRHIYPFFIFPCYAATIN
jgi:hypothetical protein